MSEVAVGSRRIDGVMVLKPYVGPLQTAQGPAESRRDSDGGGGGAMAEDSSGHKQQLGGDYSGGN